MLHDATNEEQDMRLKSQKHIKPARYLLEASEQSCTFFTVQIYADLYFKKNNFCEHVQDELE